MRAIRDWLPRLLTRQENISCRDLRPATIATLTSIQLSNLPLGGRK
ncbi:MAG: hypothetical protein Q7R56_02960 [Nanoarchaeota archaeon]|nr:hypothetical protein [Nanoarchaeota archaeon]